MEGTEFLFNHGVFSHKDFILINEKGEKSILYGNDLLKKMIEKVPDSFKMKEFLLVLNQKQELIAICSTQCDSISYKDLKLENTVAKNLVDKGYYLRKEQ